VELVKSLIILFSVSASVAGCFYLLNLPFWPVFGLSSIFQIFIFNLFSTWKKQKAAIEFELIQNERIKEFSKQGIECICPDENCAAKTFVPIQLDKENRYECPNCKKNIKVYIGSKTFLETTPVSEDPFKDFNFVEGKDYDN
tara:strand:+ start:215 stop:640 length:426 start_codon:yes stop_codon:yes gene_type:complete